jgi:hypothetical protein
MQIEAKNNDKQRTDKWHTERLGKFSCSQFHRLIGEPKSKADKEAGNLNEKAMTYIMECVAERLTGKKAKDDFNSKYTDWGVDNEPIAKGIYSKIKEVEIVDSNYIPYLYNSGGSPDGLICNDGILEIKCPYTITSHLNHKLFDIPEEYYWQCLGYLLITARDWIDFMSYHPDYPGIHQVVLKRIERKDVIENLDKLDSKLQKAESVAQEIINKLTN